MSILTTTIDTTHQTLDVQGRHFQLLNATGTFAVTIYGEGWEVSTTLFPGLALSFVDRSVYPTPFNRVMIRSEVTSQQVSLWAGHAEVGDNRATGGGDSTINVLGAASKFVSFLPEQTLNTADGIVNLLGLNTKRKEATVEISGSGFIGGAEKGIYTEGGLIKWENQQPMPFEADVNGVRVRVMEETN